MQPPPVDFPANLLLSLAGAGSLSALAGRRALAAGAPRPNIVLFLSDDMGWKEAGFNGNKDVPTLTMNSIAREGVKLTQFDVQPVCSPSRSCLMTGRYPWKMAWSRDPPGWLRMGMLFDERTIAQALRDAGYATWMLGKWHLGEWQTAHLPLARGSDHHYGFYGALIDSFTAAGNSRLAPQRQPPSSRTCYSHSCLPMKPSA